MTDDFPPVGATVEIEYTVDAPGEKRTKSITETVADHQSSAFVLDTAGLGVKVTDSGRVFGPTSSDGWHADGDTRVRIGYNAEVTVLDEPNAEAGGC